MQPWNTRTINKHAFPFGQGTLPLADEKMTSLPSHQDVASIAGNVLRRQSNIHFGKMRMWMPLVPRSFPPKDCLGDLQALKRRFSRSHVRLLVLVVTKSRTCKRLMRRFNAWNRWGIASNSSVEFTWDTLADLTLQPASWTTNYMHCKNASPGIWQSRATARMKTRFSLAWQAHGMLESFVRGFEWAEFLSRCLFCVLGEVKAMQWVGPEYSKHEDNWDWFNGFKSAVFARVGFLPSSFTRGQEALLAPLHGLFYQAISGKCASRSGG